MSFTREEALKYHRDMWNKIKEKYGNDASSEQREEVKEEYIEKKQHSCKNLCYLCEYSVEVGKRNYDYCNFCPIDWTELADEEDFDRGTCIAVYKNSSYKSIYECAPIDEILALPERKEV